ncbi:MAG: sporulation protein [Halobellus sp.]|uniref:sporulation protein n=1 Tax=Halobellus sp. TaxID=1979212 RepID=UPI0035D522E7
MKKVLASTGIGNATVDTVLPATTVTPGETVEASVQITGGTAEQVVEEVRLALETRAKTADGYTDVGIARFTLAESVTIEPETDERYPADIDIPYQTLVTLGSTRVWIETELNIDLAVDPEDTDHLEVEPTPRLRAVFDALEELGFSFRAADCEYDPYGRYTDGRQFVQEFEFRPQSGSFVGNADEVELVARTDAKGLTVFVEVYKRSGMLSELAETDEWVTRTTTENTDVTTISERLRSLIEERV